MRRFHHEVLKAICRVVMSDHASIATKDGERKLPLSISSPRGESRRPWELNDSEWKGYKFDEERRRLGEQGKIINEECLILS